jgi:hypothetical protein
VTPEALDNYLGDQVTLPIGGEQKTGTVKRRARDHRGNLVGTQNSNPILDTRTYEVMFQDGMSAEYSANIIAENMFAQCDAESNQHVLFDSIIDHNVDDSAIKHADRFVIVNGKQHPRKSTKGWKLCVKWKDGSTSWERLSPAAGR